MRNEKGFTLVEIVMALGLLAGITFGLMQFTDFSNREIKAVSEDIDLKINQLGAERFILTEVLNSFPGFNYLNIQDDSDKWFYAFDPEFVCEGDDCKRSITLSVPDNETESKAFYMLVLKANFNEALELNFDPERVLDDSGNYTRMNEASDVNLSISKSSNNPTSPWQSNRLMLLSSNIRMFDCFNGLISERSGCSLLCTNPQTCNRSIKRRVKLLGLVDNLEEELIPIDEGGGSSILKYRFQGARQNSNGSFASYFPVFMNNSPEIGDFFEKLPYIPGINNNVLAQPVELVRYYLKRDGDAKKTKLIRQKATFVGNRPVFEGGHTLLVGAQSIEFTRSSPSSPSIVYKLNRFKRYNN